MDDKVTFLASFPALQSALKISGDGTGMRIMLEIPESEMAEAIKLMLYRQVALEVTIKSAPKTALKSITAKAQKKSEWVDPV